MKHEMKQLDRINSLSQSLMNGDDPFPQIIEIHPTDICNHACDYCYHGGSGYDPSRARDLLTIEQYQSLFIEMMQLKISDLSISGGGEPTIDNRLPEIISSASQNSIVVRLVTNGNFVDNELLSLMGNIEEIRFSVDAISAATYSRVRNVPKGLFYKTIENIQKIIEFKKANSLGLKVGATFLVS